jgi:hypothetical protein
VDISPLVAVTLTGWGTRPAHTWRGYHSLLEWVSHEEAWACASRLPSFHGREYIHGPTATQQRRGAIAMANVAHYAINYTSESDKPWVASINCYDQPEGEAGGRRIATLRFFDGAVPASGTVDGAELVNFPLSRFADVVAILRNETRIFVGRSSGGPDNETSEGISSFTAARQRP